MSKIFFVCIFCWISCHLMAQENNDNQNGRYQISATTRGDKTEVYVLDTVKGTIWMSETFFGYYTSWYELPPLPIKNLE